MRKLLLIYMILSLCFQAKAQDKTYPRHLSGRWKTHVDSLLTHVPDKSYHIVFVTYRQDAEVQAWHNEVMAYVQSLGYNNVSFDYPHRGYATVPQGDVHVFVDTTLHQVEFFSQKRYMPAN